MNSNQKVNKVVSGFGHSLLLTTDGSVYGFGDNQFRQIGVKDKDNRNIPTKVESKTKLKDIAANFFGNISVAISEDNCCYVWGECSHELISTPRRTQYKSIHDIFANYSKRKITYKPMFLENMSSNGVIDSIIGLFNNQIYSDIKFKVENKYILK